MFIQVFFHDPSYMLHHRGLVVGVFRKERPTGYGALEVFMGNVTFLNGSW